MLSRNRLIQRLRSACSQRRLFTGERGAIAASLIEIGVAMLAVGILTAGAVTTFTGFIDSASDTTARGRLTDASSTADQVYNWLRPGGTRCYDDTDCAAVSNTTAVESLQEAAGGQLAFAGWDTTFPAANTIYVQVETANPPYLPGASNRAATSDAHNGIAGNPDAGQWVRLAVKSDSGATFCVIKVAHTADPIFEGVGFMSVHSDASETTQTAAHCGGHLTATGSGAPTNATAASCVYGSDGASTADSANVSRTASDMSVGAPVTGPALDTDNCATDRALGRPGGGFNVGATVPGTVAGARTS